MWTTDTQRRRQRLSGREVMSWRELKTHLLDDLRSHNLSSGWYIDFLVSPALQDAMAGSPETVNESIGRLMRISGLLSSIQILVMFGRDRNPGKLASALRRTEQRRETLLYHLSEAARLTSGDCRKEILSISERAVERLSKERDLFELAASRMNPNLLGRRGRASYNDRSAFLGWCVRELDCLVRVTARNRYSAVSRMLASVGMTTKPQNVRGIVYRGRT